MSALGLALSLLLAVSGVAHAVLMDGIVKAIVMPMAVKRRSLAHFPTIGVMLVVIAAISPTARAAPIVLACYGESKVLGPAGADQSPWKDAHTVKIDVDAHTITIDEYDPAQLLIGQDANENPLGMLPSSGHETDGISTGTIDRITGAIDVNIFPASGRLIGFRGTCKPAKKLF